MSLLRALHYAFPLHLERLMIRTALFDRHLPRLMKSCMARMYSIDMKNIDWNLAKKRD